MPKISQTRISSKGFDKVERRFWLLRPVVVRRFGAAAWPVFEVLFVYQFLRPADARYGTNGWRALTLGFLGTLTGLADKTLRRTLAGMRAAGLAEATPWRLPGAGGRRSKGLTLAYRLRPEALAELRYEWRQSEHHSGRKRQSEICQEHTVRDSIPGPAD